MYKELRNRGIGSNQYITIAQSNDPESSDVDTKDEYLTITARQKIPRPRYLVFASKAQYQVYIVVYSERYGFVQIRNSSRKYNKEGELVKYTIGYAKGNRKTKLVKYRTSVTTKVKKTSQKSDYRVRGTIATIDKEYL